MSSNFLKNKLKLVYSLFSVFLVGSLITQSAFSTIEDTGATPQGISSNLKNYAGMKILIGDTDIQLNEVNKLSTSTFSQVKIGTTLNGGQMGTFSYSNNKASITGVTLLANTEYYIENYMSSATGWAFDSTCNTPISKTYLSYTKYLVDNYQGDDYCVEIQSLDVEVITSSTPQVQANVNDFYNTSNINISVFADSNGNISYKLNGGVSISICNDCNRSTLSLTSLSEQAHSIEFALVDSNGETTLTKNFTVDTTKPTINLFNTTQSNSYNVLWSNFFNYSDINFKSCLVQYNNSDYNCSSYNFLTAQNKTINVLVEDLAGNTQEQSFIFLVNPLHTIYFNNKTGSRVTNFSLNNENYIDSFQFNTYNYSLGENTFTFIKSGLEKFIFTLNLTETSNFNLSYNLNAPYITIKLKNLKDNNLINKTDFRILYFNNNDNQNKVYNIVNNNTLVFRNDFDVNKSITLNLIYGNKTLTNEKLIAPFENTEIIFYITAETLETKFFEVLTPSLVEVPNTDVYLYLFNENTNDFILYSQKQTNEAGVVSFEVVPNKYIYNVCNSYNSVEKCLKQKVFDTIESDFQIIHLQDYKGTTRNILNNLEWSAAETERTASTSQVTFNFKDLQTNVESFCINVDRYTNNQITYNNSFCKTGYSGAIVQTFNLLESQHIKYSFNYILDNQSYPLKQLKVYFNKAGTEDLKTSGVLDLFLIIVFFGAVGVLLGTKNLEIYIFGIAAVMLAIVSLQAYFNANYMHVGMWGFLTLKSGFLYYVRKD